MHKPTTAFIGALCVALTTATHAGPSVYSNQAKATDLGSVHSFQADGPVTLTIAMKLTHADELESLLNSVYTKSDPNYRHFLTTQEFNARFGPTESAVTRVTQHLRAAGLTVAQSTPSHLSVTGSISAIEPKGSAVP